MYKLDKRSSISIIVFILLILFNYLTIGQANNLILAIPQFFTVLIFIVKRDYKKALFLHLLFVVTSIAPIRTMHDVPVYNYFGLKLIGLIAAYQIISLILYVLILTKYKVNEKNVLFYTFRNIIGYLAASATVIGISGWAFFNYFPSYIMSNVIYMFFLYIHIDMLLRFVGDENFKKKIFDNAIYLLIAAPIAICIGFNFFGIGTTYGGLSVIIQSELSFFAIILLVALLFFKNILWIIISLACLCFNLVVSGRGGEILFFLVGIFIFLILLFSKKSSFNKTRKDVMRFGSLAVAILLIGFFSIFQFSQLTQIKFQQVVSLFNIFFLANDYSSILDIGSSPYVRTAQVLNILHNGLINPFFLLFGHGYGGYFTDSLGLFNDLDLTLGAYSPEIVVRGQFPSAHGALPSTLLYNGIIGIILIGNLGIKYIRKIKDNFLAFGAIILFFYGLYFNLLLALTAVFLLFASEYKIKPLSNR